MRPEEIGDLLGTDPESVIVAREAALEQLASELGMDDVSELESAEDDSEAKRTAERSKKRYEAFLEIAEGGGSN